LGDGTTGVISIFHLQKNIEITYFSVGDCVKFGCLLGAFLGMWTAFLNFYF